MAARGCPRPSSSWSTRWCARRTCRSAPIPACRGGAYHAIALHGDDELKALYLPKLADGRWSGTMCLTEPQCGTDLGLIRTRAEPAGDGSYRISGTKIFISAGEHDLTENIVHLVLARLPDAPKGIKGISLFLVPKLLPKDDGAPGPAQRRRLRRHRAQDGPQRLGDLRDELRRGDRLAARRAAPRHAGDVHDDERRPARGRHPGPGRRRDRLSERRRLCPRAPAGPRADRARSTPTRRPIRSSSIPTCGACC